MTSGEWLYLIFVILCFLSFTIILGYFSLKDNQKNVDNNNKVISDNDISGVLLKNSNLNKKVNKIIEDDE